MRRPLVWNATEGLVRFEDRTFPPPPIKARSLAFLAARAGGWITHRDFVAAGDKTARRTKAIGGICTQFGIPSPMAMMSLWAANFETTAAATIGELKMNIRDGRDTVSLMHINPAANMTILGQVLDYAKTRLDAGEPDLMTVPARYSRIAARSGVS